MAWLMRYILLLLVFLNTRWLSVQGFAPPWTTPLGRKFQHQNWASTSSFGSTRPPVLITKKTNTAIDFCSEKKHHELAQRKSAAQTRTTRLDAAPGAVTDELVTLASMAALAIQSGSMPTLQKKCISKDICRSTVVIAQEMGKFILFAICLFLIANPAQRQAALAGWSMLEGLQLAGLPAALFAIQSYSKLIASQHLPAVTFSVLNQTKTISTAIFCYLLLGKRQSPLQMVALVLLILSALVIEEVLSMKHFKSVLGSFSSRFPRLSLLRWMRAAPQHRNRAYQQSLFSTSSNATLGEMEQSNVDAGSSSQIQNDKENDANVGGRDPYHISRGVVPLIAGNLASGLASALGQRALLHNQRNLYVYGMEMSSASILILLSTLLWSKDGQRLRKEGVTKHWEKRTWLPVVGQSMGGILVGLVTKYAGAVEKGFALIFGTLISGLLQKWISHEKVTNQQIIGGILTCVSVWLYSSFPPSA